MLAVVADSLLANRILFMAIDDDQCYVWRDMSQLPHCPIIEGTTLVSKKCLFLSPLCRVG